MKTLQPFQSIWTLVALPASLWAPVLWILVLNSGSRYDDYARQEITGNVTDALVLPGLALWGGASVLALSYWLVSRTVGQTCSILEAAIAVLLSGIVIYTVAACMMPHPGSSGDWFFSVSTITVQDTKEGGLIAAAIVAGFALPGWAHYGGIRVNRAWEAQNTESTKESREHTSVQIPDD